MPRSAFQTKPRTVPLSSITKSGERLEPRLLLTSVVGVSPDVNAQVVSKTAQISIEFDVDINPATATANSFEIRSSQTAYSIHPPQVSGRHISILLLGQFNEGEVIHVTATQGITSIAGDPLDAPFVWQFRTATSDGTGIVVDEGRSHVGIPRLVSDINLTPTTHSAWPEHVTEAGGLAFFVTNSLAGRMLWSSDGTTVGTKPIQELPAEKGSRIFLTSVGNSVFFKTTVGDTQDLWHSDGTSEGTHVVTSFTDSRRAKWTEEFQGRLMFSVERDASRSELWTSDGTTVGTLQITEISGDISNITSVGSEIYFKVSDSGTYSLWKSDGTSIGTMQVKDFGRFDPWQLTDVGGQLFFNGADETPHRELWRSDGSKDGTYRVKDSSGTTIPRPEPLVAVGEKLFFASNNALWATDGTSSGTVLLKDARPSSMTAVGNRLFFSLSSDSDIWTDEIWVTDGTASGTMAVTGTAIDGRLRNLTGVGDRLYFTTEDTGHLWETDGTRTSQIEGISGDVRELTAVNGRLIFLDDGDLWTVDAQEAVLVRKMQSGTEGSDPRSTVELNGDVYFVANNGDGHFLWHTDRTAGATQRLSDVRVGWQKNFIGGFGVSEYDLVKIEDSLYFIGDDSTNGRQLWKSDGTVAGTKLFKDFQPNNDDSNLRTLTNIGGALYFVLPQHNSSKLLLPQDYRSELWTSDGTIEGTVTAVERLALPWYAPAMPLTEFQERLFFVAEIDEVRGVWTSDGTGEGTHFLKEASFRRPCSDGRESCAGPTYNTFTAANEALYYATDVLWKTDGTIEGTIQLTDEQSGFTYPSSLTSVGDTLFFVNGWNSRRPHGGRGELWKSDGTSEGTVLVKDIYGGELTSDPQDLINVEGVLYFSANDGLSGRELWRSDGTQEGTRRVKDIWPGTGSSNPTNLHNVNGQLWFSAENGVGGPKLWTSDGTESGTRLVEGAASAPDDFILVDDELYFTAWTVANGRELWSLHLNQDDENRGDLNGDGNVTAGDIDLLFAAIRDSNSDARFDLDSNGHVDEFDVTFLTESLLRTFRGDVNLDGQVAFDDFLVLSTNFETRGDASHADGDLNGDQVVNFADFLILANDFGKGPL